MSETQRATEDDAERAGSFVARLAGGVGALVLLAVAGLGIFAGARTARLYEAFGARLDAAIRQAMTARLHAIGRAVARQVVEAEEDDDWSLLQAGLPTLMAGEPGLLLLSVTDADGLVLADADVSHNGHPLPDPQLRSLLGKARDSVDLTVGDQAGIAAVTPAGAPGGATRLVWTVLSAESMRADQVELRREAREAVRFGWLLVGLGGLLAAVAAIGAVVLIGASIARRLRVVAWRIGELGRGDLTTHLQLDGPSELRRIGAELDRAAARLSEAARAERSRTIVHAEAVARRALVTQAIGGAQRHGELEIAGALCELDDAHACASGSAARERGALVVFVEIVSEALADLLLAAELRTAALALAAADRTLGPAELLARLDALVPPNVHARALVILVEDHVARVASAGARFPIVCSGATARALVIAGDRLGQVRPQRGPEQRVSLAPGDALVLVAEAPLGRSLDGHAARGLMDAVVASATQLGAAARARAVTAAADGPRPSVAVVISRGSVAEILAGERGAGEHRGPDARPA